MTQTVNRWKSDVSLDPKRGSCGSKGWFNLWLDYRSMANDRPMHYSLVRVQSPGSALRVGHESESAPRVNVEPETRRNKCQPHSLLPHILRRRWSFRRRKSTRFRPRGPKSGMVSKISHTPSDSKVNKTSLVKPSCVTVLDQTPTSPLEAPSPTPTMAESLNPVSVQQLSPRSEGQCEGPDEKLLKGMNFWHQGLWLVGTEECSLRA